MILFSYDLYFNYFFFTEIYDDLDKDENGKLRFIIDYGIDVWRIMEDL